MAVYYKETGEFFLELKDLKRVIFKLLEISTPCGAKKWQDNHARRLIEKMNRFFVSIGEEMVPSDDIDASAIYELLFKPLSQIYSDANTDRRNDKKNSLELLEGQAAFFAALSYCMNGFQVGLPIKDREQTSEYIDKSWDAFSNDFHRALSNSVLLVRDIRFDYFDKESTKKQNCTTKNITKRNRDSGINSADSLNDTLEDIEDDCIAIKTWIYEEFLYYVEKAFKKRYTMKVELTPIELKLMELLEEIKHFNIFLKKLILNDFEQLLDTTLSRLKKSTNEDDLSIEYMQNRDFPDIDFDELEAQHREKKSDTSPDEHPDSPTSPDEFE